MYIYICTCIYDIYILTLSLTHTHTHTHRVGFAFSAPGSCLFQNKALLARAAMCSSLFATLAPQVSTICRL